MNKHTVREILGALDRGMRPVVPCPIGGNDWRYIDISVQDLKSQLIDLDRETVIPCEISGSHIWFDAPAGY